MQLATPSLANPFLAPEFAMAVGRFRPNTQVAVLTEGQSIAGFFPFERRRLGVGLPICGWLNPRQGIIHAPGVDWNPRELLRESRLSAWRFDNLITDQQPFKPYHATTMPSAMISLSDGFDAYYTRLRVKSPRFCRELDRRARKLAREAGEIRMAADSRDTHALRKLMAWKSEQYRQTSHVDRFEQPWLVGLFDALLATRGDHVSGLLSVLYVGDQPIAAQFGLRASNLVVGWFTAYDKRFRKYSPGLINLKHMIEEMTAAGINTIDMGGGAENYYKETLKSYDSFVAKGAVTSRSMLGATHHARIASTLWAKRAVHQRPGFHKAADQILRNSGFAKRIYGRVLGVRLETGKGKIARSDSSQVTPGAQKAILATRRRSLQMVLRLLAAAAEQWLGNRLNDYLRDNNEYRAITRHLLHLGGTITRTPRAITVTLDPPAAPRIARALALLLEEINAAPPRMPGNTRLITYQLAAHPRI